MEDNNCRDENKSSILRPARGREGVVWVEVVVVRRGDPDFDDIRMTDA